MNTYRRRSVAELRERAKQWMATCSERLRISSQARLPDDAAFMRMLCPTWASSPDAALDQFRARCTPRFFAPFDERAEAVAALFISRRKFCEPDQGRRLRQGFSMATGA